MHLKTVREVTVWFPGEPIDKWRLFLENIFLNSLIIMEAKRRLSGWFVPVILIFRRLRREDSEFEASLSYMVRLFPPKKWQWGGGLFIYDPSSEIQLRLEFSKNEYS